MNPRLTFPFHRLKKNIPPSWQIPLRRVFHSLENLIDRTEDIFAGNTLPPKSLRHSTRSQFIWGGRDYFRWLTHEGHLKPHDQILELGSGAGRIALPLIPFLTAGGSYLGLDVSRNQIDWCRRHIQTRSPHFQFRWIDVKNSLYQAEGKIDPGQFQFPVAPESFSYVIAISLFTHLPEGQSRYLYEILRALKPGGRCFATFFLIDEISSALIVEGRSSLPFTEKNPEFYTLKGARPEQAVAFEEKKLFERLVALGFEIEKKLPGWWVGRTGGAAHQDILVLKKKVICSVE